MSSALPPAPAALRALTPHLQRFAELRTADAALAYWVLYRAARLGLQQYAALEPPARAFLTQLMDVLEAHKAAMRGDARVESDETGKAYVEGRARDVFGRADAEDRQGKAGRNTARAFLAASTFLDVLSEFGELDEELGAKHKYAKWKAADIAKALREGRVPVPGPAGGLSADEIAAAQAEAGLAALGVPVESARAKEEEDAYVARELARLTAGSPGPGPVDDAASPARAFSPADASLDVETPRKGLRAESRLSRDVTPGLAPQLPQAPPAQGASVPLGSPNFSLPMSARGQLSRAGSESGIAPGSGAGAGSGDIFASPSGAPSQLAYSPTLPPTVPPSASPRPLPHPQGGSSTLGLSPNLSPSSAAAAAAAAAAGHAPFAPAPPGSAPAPHPPRPPPPRQSTSGFLSHGSGAAGLPGTPGSSFLPPPPQPSAPPAVAPSLRPSAPAASAPPFAAAPPQPPPPAAVAPPLPTSLTHQQTTRVQKLARHAASALDYDDIETSRKLMRQALDVLEGRE